MSDYLKVPMEGVFWETNCSQKVKKNRSFKEPELQITEIRKKSPKFNITYSKRIANLNFYKTWVCKYINMTCVQKFYEVTINVKYYVIRVSLPLKVPHS
jgi:hypothetical protein